ncbi:MAG: acetyl-CoA carboxylase biotin carboxyl carrier protein [Sphingomonadaceae bacterium]|nr:acetyl-CoA carboxylase biotin carboxyl carrier protein [Sphingomonadaceae bacterium]
MTEQSPMHVDMGLVRELASLLNDTQLTEIEVEENGRRIRVARTVTAAAPVAYAAPPAAIPAAPAAAPATGAAAPSAAGPGDAVRSPMVGTAYLSPEPGAKPFVSEGDSVAEGQTLLLVEAMKVLNPITAPRAGTVAAVLVKNEQPVEFDQPLIRLA